MSFSINQKKQIMKNYLIKIVLIVLFSNPSFSQSKEVLKKINEVENNLIPYVLVKNFKTWNIYDRMKCYNVKGVSVAVIKNYKIDWAKGYGLADTLKNQKVTTSTLFSAGSISKFVMAFGALKLVQENKMRLDKPINNYLKSWKIKENEWSKTKPVTLQMLLSHTAGTSQTSYFGFTPDKKLPSIIEILNGDNIAESRGIVVNSEPGKDFRYSGGGSMVAQMAIMDVTNQSFEDFFKLNVFKKLGMKNSTFEQPLPKKLNKSASWAYSSASWFKGMPYVYPQQAAAGLYITPTDLAKFCIEIQKSYLGKGKILNQNLTKKMLTPQAFISDGSYREDIGIGPFLIQKTDNKSEKGKYFEFTGVNAGFLAYAIASVEDGNGVIVMLNSGDDVNGLGKEIRRAVAKTYNWTHFLPKEMEPIILDKKDLIEMTGRYKSGEDEVISMEIENDYLVERFNNGNPIYCFPISKDSIVFSDYNIKGVFGRDEKGKINSLKNIYQKEGMPKMKDNEFAPNELLTQKKYAEAKVYYAKLKMDEYKIAYLAYDLLNRKNADLLAVKTILELAEEQNPKSSIVFCRWGDYYLILNDKQKAIQYYKKALILEPENNEVKTTISKLSN
jgi:CubicO group peptidase (beta-lactamase class C family)